MSEDKSKLQLIGELAQSNNKNLELIEEINEKEDEIERLNNIIDKAVEYIYENAYDEEREMCIDDLWVDEIKGILEILDKEKE